MVKYIHMPWGLRPAQRGAARRAGPQVRINCLFDYIYIYIERERDR